MGAPGVKLVGYEPDPDIYRLPAQVLGRPEAMREAPSTWPARPASASTWKDSTVATHVQGAWAPSRSTRLVQLQSEVLGELLADDEDASEVAQHGAVVVERQTRLRAKSLTTPAKHRCVPGRAEAPLAGGGETPAIPRLRAPRVVFSPDCSGATAAAGRWLRVGRGSDRQGVVGATCRDGGGAKATAA
jgi:hypothetical protein